MTCVSIPKNRVSSVRNVLNYSVSWLGRHLSYIYLESLFSHRSGVHTSGVDKYSAICRRRLCLYSTVVQQVVVCATFAVLRLCWFFVEIFPFIMASRCKSDSSDFCPTL